MFLGIFLNQMNSDKRQILTMTGWICWFLFFIVSMELLERRFKFKIREIIMLTNNDEDDSKFIFVLN